MDEKKSASPEELIGKRKTYLIKRNDVLMECVDRVEWSEDRVVATGCGNMVYQEGCRWYVCHKDSMVVYIKTTQGSHRKNRQYGISIGCVNVMCR